MTMSLLLVLSYLLGSVPFGVLIARLRGVNLRMVGSGNIGATNVLRSVGKREALLTLAGDALKGTLPVVIVKLSGYQDLHAAAAGLCAVLGHNYSAFLRFRGGKGVATSLGVLCGYAPPVGGFTVLVWLLTVALFRYSSLGALTAYGLMPVSMLIVKNGTVDVGFALMLTGLIYVRHRDNLKRLINGEEPKIGQRMG